MGFEFGLEEEGYSDVSVLEKLQIFQGVHDY
jgi:hypothetical protein